MRTELVGTGDLGGLYAITPDWSDSPRLLAVTEAILAGGCKLVQYRNKAATDHLRREQALALRALTRKYRARLIINDDLDLALLSEADGVHLGGEDGDLRAARVRLGTGRILGASCYQDIDRALESARAGADYIAFGSFFASPTKPLAKRADAGLLAAGKTGTGLPVCAIGGITPGNAGDLVRAGADLLAVITALYEADDPYQAAQQFVILFEESP
jgi:thiamine-phosphate pyrophosphorylase